MQRLKFLALAAMLVLVAGTLFGSQAQKRMAVHRVMPPVPVVGLLSGTYATSVTATEISGGQQDNLSNETYGWTTYGATKGDLCGFFFLSVNYSSPDFGVDPIEVDPGVRQPANRIVTGGSWSKLIFVDGVYQGSVAGRIIGGTLNWDEKSQTTAVELKLTTDNATDAFAGNVGTGSFEGTMDRIGKALPTLSGTLTLKY